MDRRHAKRPMLGPLIARSLVVAVYAHNTSLSRSTRHLPSAKRLSPRPVSARALMPSWEGTTARIYPSSIRRSRCSSGIVRWLGRFLISFKEANSSAVRRGLFRNEEDKWFLIRQICGVLTWGDSQSSDQSNGPAPETPSPVQRPSRIKHRRSFGLVFSCQRFCNLCQPRGCSSETFLLHGWPSPL
jgi:hypothetical protein